MRTFVNILKGVDGFIKGVDGFIKGVDGLVSKLECVQSNLGVHTIILSCAYVCGLVCIDHAACRSTHCPPVDNDGVLREGCQEHWTNSEVQWVVW